MSTLTAALELPSWVTAHVKDGPAASVDRDRRALHWTLHTETPATIHRNTFTWAWITVTEQQMWRGEPLSLFAERRQTESAIREPFTPAAREAMHAEVVSAVTRYGFDRLWGALNTGRVASSVGRAQSMADDAAMVLRWHTDLVELLAMFAAGECDVIPEPPTPLGQRTPKVPTMGHDNRPSMTPVAAKLTVHGEHVGWLDPSGSPIPTGEQLAGYWRTR